MFLITANTFPGLYKFIHLGEKSWIYCTSNKLLLWVLLVSGLVSNFAAAECSCFMLSCNSGNSFSLGHNSSCTFIYQTATTGWATVKHRMGNLIERKEVFLVKMWGNKTKMENYVFWNFKTTRNLLFLWSQNCCKLFCIFFLHREEAFLHPFFRWCKYAPFPEHNWN